MFGFLGLQFFGQSKLGVFYRRVPTRAAPKSLMMYTLPADPTPNATLVVQSMPAVSVNSTPAPNDTARPAQEAAALPKISLYFINLKADHEREQNMLRETRKLQTLGIEAHRVVGFPIRNQLFVSQLQRSGRISLNCTEYVATLAPLDSAVVDLCATEGFTTLDLDIGMYRALLPTNFVATRGLRALGALGCSVSHLLALRRAYLSGDDYALVSEDDVSWDPFIAVVSANTELVRKTVDPAWEAPMEAHAYVQALSTCAVSKAGAAKQPWPPGSVDQDRIKRAEAHIGTQKPVVLQMATIGGIMYRNWRRYLDRRGGDCVGNRNGCEFILQSRRYHDWGTQAVMWNRAAIEYMVHLFWDPHNFSRAESALWFPNTLPPQSKHPFADTLFYNLPHPFGSSFLVSLPLVQNVPHLSKYSAIDEGPWSAGYSHAGHANESWRGFVAYVASNCNHSTLAA
jgi:hypothetical protein